MTDEEFEFDLYKFRWQAEFARKLDNVDFSDPEAVEQVLRANTAMMVEAGTHLEKLIGEVNRLIGEVNELSEKTNFIDWWLAYRCSIPWWKRWLS